MSRQWLENDCRKVTINDRNAQECDSYLLNEEFDWDKDTPDPVAPVQGPQLLQHEGRNVQNEDQ